MFVSSARRPSATTLLLLSWLTVLLSYTSVQAEARNPGQFSLGPDSLDQVSRWGYQLQDADPAELAESPYDLVVIDYSSDGTDAGAYSFEDIQLIRNSGKIVLAYLSLGEAESYRFYWKNWWQPGFPQWLGPENPDWPENYKVKYWYPGWWDQAILPYLDRILAAGFDGVYIDIIDAYWYWHVAAGYPVALTANLMIYMVNKVAHYCRASRPGFVICPQNGESIIDDASPLFAYLYLGIADAIGVEDLFYHFGSPADQQYRMNLLELFAAAGKKVMNIEYISQYLWPQYGNMVCAAPFEIIAYGAAPDRELDELIDFPQPICPGSQ